MFQFVSLYQVSRTLYIAGIRMIFYSNRFVFEKYNKAVLLYLVYIVYESSKTQALSNRSRKL